MIEETIRNKMKELIENSNENDKDFIFEIYQSEMKMNSEILRCKTDVEIQKLKSTFDYKSKIAELGLFDTDFEEKQNA
jgi:hypothetical protein